MRLNACIAGVGMTRFMKYPDKGLKELGTEAAASRDRRRRARDRRPRGRLRRQLRRGAGDRPGVDPRPGRCSTRSASGRSRSSTSRTPAPAARRRCSQACMMVSAGIYDVVLALGVEKLTHPDKTKSFAAFAGAVDVDELKEMLESLSKAAEAGGRRGGRRPEPLHVHGRLRERRPGAHGALRHHGGAVRGGGGEELLPRQPEPARPVPAGAERRGRAERADDRASR